MKITAGARFNAARRLASRDRFANLSLAFYSGILLSFSVIAVAFTLDPLVSQALSVIGIFISVMMLIFSMKMFAERYAVESEQMHRCALEINEIRRRFSAEGIEKPAIFKKATSEYNMVLQKYSLSHADEDYAKYKYNNKFEFDHLKNNSKVSDVLGLAVLLIKENIFERFSVILSGVLLIFTASALIVTLWNQYN